MRKTLTVLFILIIILGIAWFFFHRSEEVCSDTGVVVDTMITELGNISSSVITEGIVIADSEREIIAEINGFIRILNIKEGDIIKQNEIVVVIENPSLDKDIKEAYLKLKESEIDYQKLIDIYSKQDKINDYKINTLKQELEEAKKTLDIKANSLNIEKIDLEEKLQMIKNRVNELEKEVEEKYILYKKNSIPQKEYEKAENAYKDAGVECSFLEKRLDLLNKKIIPDTMKLHTIEIEKLKNNFSLTKMSLERQMITDKELEVALNRVNYYKSYLKMLENDADKLTVKTPISGIINEISVIQGNYVNKGDIIGKVISLNDIVVEAWVDEADVNKVKVGQNVYISSDSFEGKVDGEVSSILPYATRRNNLSRFRSIISFSNKEDLLKSGGFVNLEILTSTNRSTIVIPSMAVFGEKQKYVFVKKNGRAYMKKVEIGISNPFEVEVNGIEVGEEVIVGPYPVLKTLSNGVPVVRQN